MQIETSRFGTLDIEDDKVINVVDGFLGFDDTKFILLTPTSAAPFCWLQSVETAELAFVAVDPTVFFPEYSVRITSDEHQKLGLSPEGEIVLVTLVTMAPNPAEISTNLMGPVIINPETMKATVNSQARADRSLSPVTSGCAHARSRVSCTTSSARARSP